MDGPDKKRLLEELDRYCEQLGVLPEEKPILVFDLHVIHWLREQLGYARREDMWGCCLIQFRTIFVNVSNLSDRGYGYDFLKYALVHELVHYKFRLVHGRGFDNKVKQVLAGRRYPLEHIPLLPE